MFLILFSIYLSKNGIVDVEMTWETLMSLGNVNHSRLIRENIAPNYDTIF